MFRQSLIVTVVFWVVIASTSVFVPMAVYHYWQTQDNLHKQLDNRLETAKLRLSGSLPNLLWNYNKEGVVKNIEAEVSDYAVESIVVKVDGATEYQLAKSLDEPLTYLLTGTQLRDVENSKPHTLYYRGEDGEGAVGEMYIYPNFQQIEQQLKDLVVNLIVENIILNLALSLLIIFIFYRRIISPINKTNDGLKEIVRSGADLNQRLNEDGSCELGELAKNYNKVADYVDNKLQELEQALERSEESAKLKSEFLARMSHEIRTPMNGVLGSLDLMLRGDLNEDQRNYTTLAKDSADALLVIINDILDFSKIEAGKLEIEEICFDLYELMQSCMGNFYLPAEEKGLNLKLNCENVKGHSVVGDPNRIRQVLTNIVGNAIKFTHEGEVTVNVSLHKSDKKEWYFLCEVKDTGIGIPEDKLHALFDDFSQVDASTTRKYGGTGLGLAIVDQLCELMGGGISVDSELGKGSCFSISLKLESCIQPEESPKEESVQENTAVDHKHILLVEDDMVNREIAIANLEAIGYDVDIAEDGLEAIDKLKNTTSKQFYNLILMDCLMPNLDGYETTKAIRKGEANNANLGKKGVFSGIPIIAMTANAMKGDREKCIAAGMDDYLSKPINPSELQEKLIHWLQQ